MPLRASRQLLATALALGLALATAGAQVPSMERAAPSGPPRTAAAPSTSGAGRTEELARHNNLGIAYLAQSRPAEAEARFRRALALDAGYLPALVNLGIAQMAQARHEDAAASMRAALALDPDNVYARFNLCLLLRLQGRIAEALEQALESMQRDPRDADIHYQVGSLHLAARDYDQAIERLDAVLALDPHYLSAYYGLGRAWIGKGDVPKGRDLIQKYLDRQPGSQLDGAPGLGYGEQGKYSFAMEDPASGPPAEPLAPGRVTLTDVTASSTVDFEHGATVGGAAQFSDRLLAALEGGASAGGGVLRETLAPALGPGVAIGDVDGDGLEDLFLPNAGPGAPVSALFLNRGAMRFERRSVPALPTIAGPALSGAFGHLDGDGDLDLVVGMLDRVRVFMNDGSGGFREVTEEAGLARWRTRGILGGVSLADVDHDGDLDVFAAGLIPSPASGGSVSRASAAGPWDGAAGLILINAGGSAGATDVPRFTAAAGALTLAAEERGAAGAVFSDLDNDRDIDVALASPRGGLRVLSNMRDGSFADLGPSSGLPSSLRATGLAAGDYDQDGWMDLAATSIEGGLPRLYLNRMRRADAPGGFASDEATLSGVSRRLESPLFGVTFADLDNDGHLDLLAVNGGGRGPALLVLHNEGGRYSDATAVVGADRTPARHGRGLAVADLDLDGDLDVVIGNAGGRPTLLRNDGGNRGHWVRVAPAGLHRDRAGVGTKVEIKSGLLWQKQEVAAGSGFLSQSSLVVHFGLGARASVDAVRLLWPGGVLQDEVEPPADAVVSVRELDRHGSSCPILYAFDGRAPSFISDFLGGSAVGYRTGAHSYNTPDTDEYVLIRSERLRARSGRLDLRMVNQLEETIFFDRARLHAVDHPADVEVFPDERLMPAPPFPSFRIFAVRGSRLPLEAWDGSGRDQRDLLSSLDGRYAGPGEPLPYKGYARRHELYLDFGWLEPGEPATLLLDGWIDYADSTSNLAASQAGISLVVPYVEALDEAPARPGEDEPARSIAAPRAVPGGARYLGRWVRVLDPMGFPAGLPKTVTADLTGRLPRTCRLVRIVTSMRLHWDRIRLATDLAGRPATSVLEATRARLRWRGFPALASPAGSGPVSYDYGRDEPRVSWKSHVGQFTGYGDVRELLASTDDRYVITRPGDEIALEFDAAALPRLPAGWRRDWMLYADGFGKDMDLNSASPDTVDPLPWHGMPSYPPPPGTTSPFAGAALQEALDRYHTRRVSLPVLPLRPPDP